MAGHSGKHKYFAVVCRRTTIIHILNFVRSDSDMVKPTDGSILYSMVPYHRQKHDFTYRHESAANNAGSKKTALQ